MFISNKRGIKYPTSILIDNESVEVVDNFKLLGVNIDNKLNFKKHVSNICVQINQKLFSIKRLFYLATSVKLQFFKTFIMPYFDYCLSIAIYFNKEALQKLSNCFYMCLLKLFSFNFKDWSNEQVNNFLKNYGLFSFQSRCLVRLALFSFKIVNNSNSPPNLKKQIIQTKNKTGAHTLRNSSDIVVKNTLNKFGEKCFSKFFPTMINLCFGGDYFFNINLISFKNSLLKTINILSCKFSNNFDLFNLQISTFVNFKKKNLKKNKNDQVNLYCCIILFLFLFVINK
jgi:hypothetical protein